MPHERIYGNHEFYPNNQTDAKVRWIKAQNIQDRDQDGFGGSVFVEICQSTSNDADAWVQLDRTALNRMITALRKARDGAYGADA